MNALTSRPSIALRRSPRHGSSLVWVLGSLAAVAVVGVVAGARLLLDSSAEEAEAPLTAAVVQGLFVHDVTELGEIESAKNVEIVCEVQSGTAAGTKILEIVPAGKDVVQGEFLIQFDSSALEIDFKTQEGVFKKAEAAQIQSQALAETAKITKQEYLEGLFKQEKQLLQGEKFVAEENVRRATEYLKYSQRLSAKGYATAQQVVADRFAVSKAEKELETANVKLEVLEKFTKEKMLTQLNADISAADAAYNSDKAAFRIEKEKLEQIDQQIKKCRAIAPAAGKVVYANEVNGRGQNEVVIEPGAVIRERQVVIRLPDLNNMQVVAKINESKIGYVDEGLPATIKLDSAPDVQLTGKVTRVEDYPAPKGWMSSSVKTYNTYVGIKGSHPAMRPGMTAQVRIHVRKVPSALMIPVQAIVERGGAYYVLLFDPRADYDEAWQARKIGVAATNSEFVMLKQESVDGQPPLAVGEQVVLHPQDHLDKVDLPDAPATDSPDVLLEEGPPAGEGSAEPGRGGAGSGGEEGGAPGARGQRRGARAGGSRSGGAAGGMFDARSIMQQADKNGDGVLSEAEVPAAMRSRMADVDLNGDKQIDSSELSAAIAKMQQMMSGGLPGGAAP